MAGTYKKNGFSLSGVGKIDETGIFCGGCLPPHPHYAMHVAAPEGRPGGGSMTKSFADKNLHSIYPHETARRQKN
jgi:hypothetical protein